MEFKAFAFDMDENLFFTGDVIYLFDNQENKIISVLQDEYYKLIKDTERYSHINNDIEKSMVNFRKGGGYLTRKLLEVYEKWKRGDEHVVGPSWGMFLKALKERHPISIITARGHSKEEFSLAFSALLLKMKFDGLHHLTAREQSHLLNYYPVSNKTLCRKNQITFTLPAAEKKAIFFKQFLDKVILEAKKNKDKYSKISIGFSDDSINNILKMMEYVLEKNRNNEKGLIIEYNFYDTGDRKIQGMKFLGKSI